MNIPTPDKQIKRARKAASMQRVSKGTMSWREFAKRVDQEHARICDHKIKRHARDV